MTCAPLAAAAERKEASARSGGAMSFRQLLETTSTFVTVAELVTSRGLISGTKGRGTLSLARSLAAHPRFHALSITDNPGGHAMLGADTLGTDLLSRGQEVIVHVSCKDWNRNALESRAWTLASEGFENVLALSGDYPVGGYCGRAAPVFDTDSVGLLDMFSRLEGTHFFLGAVVNTHKRYERELVPQYYKLAKKVECGAKFIINQIGYNARKEDELLRYMALKGLTVPALANVFVLNADAVRCFHRGSVPGCVVTDGLLAQAERRAASPDKGKSFFLEFGAKQCAIAKGLGFRGVYLGGRLNFADYERLLAIWDSFAQDDWKLFAREICFSQPEEFFYFELDQNTGLSIDRINRRIKSKPLRVADTLAYEANRFFHQAAFEPGTATFRAGRAICMALESRAALGRILHAAEHVLKSALFDCRDCGDCSLPDIAFLCPESQCAKNQRNGPCGGTREGLCELGDKECIWSRAYERLKLYGEQETLLERPPVFRDGSLKGTSAWANTFLGRDHHGKQRQEKK